MSGFAPYFFAIIGSENSERGINAIFNKKKCSEVIEHSGHHITTLMMLNHVRMEVNIYIDAMKYRKYRY